MDRAHAYAPGSTSNLGPGFDCLGVAVGGMGDRVVAERAHPPGVRVRSVSDPRIPLQAERNTAALAAAAVLRRAGALDLGVELEVEKGLPLAGGLEEGLRPEWSAEQRVHGDSPRDGGGGAASEAAREREALLHLELDTEVEGPRPA